MELSFARKILS